MKKFIFFTLVALISNSVFAEPIEFGIEPFQPPHPIIEVKAKKIIERHGSLLNKKAPHVFPLLSCIRFIEVPEKPKFSLQFIGSRETWIPLNGKPKKEYFYRVN